MKFLPLFAAAAGALLAFAMATTADTTDALCLLSYEDYKKLPVEGPCNVSQRLGNTYVYMHTGDEFLFHARDRGHTYTRTDTPTNIIFRVPEVFTLQVFQEKP